MIRISVLNRIIFLLTGHLAGYKVVGGMEFYPALTTFYYTIAFGMLILACLLLMILGFDILKNDSVLILASLIPVGLSLGMINQYLPQVHNIYLGASVIGLAGVTLTRYLASGKCAVITLALVHGISGILVVWMPLVLVINGKQDLLTLFISVGGIIIGVEGLLLAFLKMGKPLIPAEKLYAYFPTVLLLASLSFVAGMHN